MKRSGSRKSFEQGQSTASGARSGLPARSVIAAALFLVFSLTLSAGVQRNDSVVTTIDGVFTVDQAAKGEAIYQEKCAKCHEGDDAAGPSLTGRTFIDRWREDNLDVFFDFIQSNMPADSAGSLSDSDYVNVVARILDTNGFPEGSKELTTGSLPRIRFVGKEGPRPLPNNTLVQVVGCLAQVQENEWNLANATLPSRTRQGTETNPEELKKSAAKPLGTQQYNLQNFSRINLDFKPDPFKGHKVQVKGVLIHQSTGSDRISLTLFDSLSASCSQ